MPRYQYQHYNFIYDKDDIVRVYVSGACEFKGRKRAAAGIGVWFNNKNIL